MGSFPICYDLISMSNKNEDMLNLVIGLCHYHKYDYTKFQAIYKLAELNGWQLGELPSEEQFKNNKYLLDCSYIKEKYNCENLCPVCTILGKTVNDNKKHEEIVISYFLNNSERIEDWINKGLNENMFLATEVFEYKYTYRVLREIFKHLAEKKDIRKAAIPRYVKNMIDTYIDELEKINPSIEVFENSYKKLIENIPVNSKRKDDVVAYKFNLDCEDENIFNVLDEVIVKNNEVEIDEKKRKLNSKVSSIIEKKINNFNKETEHPEQIRIDEFLIEKPSTENTTEVLEEKNKVLNNDIPVYKDTLNEQQTIEETGFNNEEPSSNNFDTKDDNLSGDVEEINNKEENIFEDNNLIVDIIENDIEHVLTDTLESFNEYFYDILSSKDIYIEYFEDTKEFIIYVEKLERPLVIPARCTDILNSLSFIMTEELKTKISFNSVPLIYEFDKLAINVNNIFDIKMAYALWKWPVNKKRTIEDIVRSLIGYKVESKQKRNIFLEIIPKYGQLRSPFLNKHFDKEYWELYKNESLFLKLIGKSYKFGETKEYLPFKESDNFDIEYAFGVKDIKNISLPRGKVFLQGKFKNLRKYISVFVKNNINTDTSTINITPAGYKYKVNELYSITDVINDNVIQVIKYSIIELLKRRDILNTSIKLFAIADDSIILLIDETDKEPIFDALNQSMVVTAKTFFPDYVPKININYL